MYIRTYDTWRGLALKFKDTGMTSYKVKDYIYQSLFVAVVIQHVIRYYYFMPRAAIMCPGATITCRGCYYASGGYIRSLAIIYVYVCSRPDNLGAQKSNTRSNRVTT